MRSTVVGDSKAKELVFVGVGVCVHALSSEVS